MRAALPSSHSSPGSVFPSPQNGAGPVEPVLPLELVAASVVPCSVVPPVEVARMIESVERVLFRELSEVLQTPMAAIHTRIARGLKSKLAPDT